MTFISLNSMIRNWEARVIKWENEAYRGEAICSITKELNYNQDLDTFRFLTPSKLMLSSIMLPLPWVWYIYRLSLLLLLSRFSRV